MSLLRQVRAGAFILAVLWPFGWFALYYIEHAYSAFLADFLAGAILPMIGFVVLHRELTVYLHDELDPGDRPTKRPGR